MDISVVVPLLNEAESLPELEAWIRRVMDENGFSYEIVFVDDGSTDNSWAVIQQLSEANPNVKALRFRRNYGIKWLRATLSSQWTPICRIAPMRYLVFTK